MYSFRFHLNITADTTTGIQVYQTFKKLQVLVLWGLLSASLFTHYIAYHCPVGIDNRAFKIPFFALPSHRPKVFRSPGKYTGVKADCCCLKRNKKTNHELLNSGSAMNRKIVVHNKSADSKKPFWAKTIFLVIV